MTLRTSPSNGRRGAAPPRKGFGSLLIERALAIELNGEVQIQYNPQGLVCEIVAPLSAAWDEETMGRI
jgi:two-component sensor histidine kinase